MPGLSVFVVELGLNEFCDITVVRRSETFQALNGADDGVLSHFRVHVVSLNPDPSIS